MDEVSDFDAISTMPHCPTSWLAFCASNELGRGPQTREFLGRKLVAFRTESSHVAVLDAQCIHMGADLGQGTVVGEALQCPFHHWKFGVDGKCRHIPASSEIPAFARQVAYPAQERHGSVFFSPSCIPRFSLPFFDDCEPGDLVRAEPFALVLDCPWYMVGANAVDVQHFQTTHARELMAPPEIDYPHPLAHRSTTRFKVVGKSLCDRLTRVLAGPEVTMRVTDWGGTLFFVRATFRRTQTYGMVSLLPLERRRTLVYVTVAVRRSRGRMFQLLVDPLRARIRRFFIEQFLRPDIQRSAWIDYSPETLIEADDYLRTYFRWLAKVHTGRQDGSHLGPDRNGQVASAFVAARAE